MRVAKILGVLGIAIAGPALALSEDSGKIQNIYVSSTGNVAFKLATGFPTAVTNNECTSNNGYAGAMSASMDPVMKSAILAAKAAGLTVTVETSGCDNSGSWLKITEIYIQ